MSPEVVDKGFPSAVRKFRLQPYGKGGEGQFLHKAFSCKHPIYFLFKDAVGTLIEHSGNKAGNAVPRRAGDNDDVGIPAQKISRQIVCQPADPVVQMLVFCAERFVCLCIAQPAGDLQNEPSFRPPKDCFLWRLCLVL